jgi:hypothetical protein
MASISEDVRTPFFRSASSKAARFTALMAAAGFAAGSTFEEGFVEGFAAGVPAAELDAPGTLPLAAPSLPFSAETVATATARTATAKKIPLSFRMDVVSLVSAYVHNPAELAFFLFIVHGEENRAA